MTTKLQVTLFCHSFVGTMFAEMHNPKYRGDGFTWDNFPDMVERLCKVSVYQSVVFKNDKLSNKYSEMAGKLGKEIATQLVKRMTE